MQKIISLKLLPSEAANEQAVKQYIADSEGIDPTADVSGYTYPKKLD